MSNGKQLVLLLGQKLNSRRVKEELQPELVRKLAELLLQAVQNKGQGASSWKK